LHQRAAAVVGVGGALLLAACASTPPEPTVALKAAEQAIAAADQTRVADAASPELSEAREKLTAARAAVQGKQMVEAERLAMESRVDAELASARIEASKAKAVNDEMKRSTDTLTQEMQRKTGDKQ
jgi:putative cell wall-binding protein